MSVLRRLARPLQIGSLYGLLFLLPFSKAAIEICFGLMFVGWLIEHLDPATRAETVWASASLRPLVLAVAGFVAICALSIAVSDFPAQSVRALFSKWLEYLLLMVVAADLAARPKVLGRGMMIMAVSAVFVVIEAVSQELTGTGLFRGHAIGWTEGSDYQRMIGPYESPIDLATYLMAVIPIMLGFSMTRKMGFRWALWALITALVLCMARTEATGAWVSLLAGLAVLVAMSRAMRRAGLALIAACALAGGIFLQQQGHLLSTFSTSDIGARDRIVMWRAAIGMIRDRPLLGHGLNTFMANYLDYWVGGERQPRYAHNCYLQVAAETGVVGLLLFVTLLWLLFRRLLAGLRRIRDGDRMILLGFLGSLLAFVLQAGIDTNFYSLRQAALFWTMAGLAVGFSARASDPA